MLDFIVSLFFETKSFVDLDLGKFHGGEIATLKLPKG